MVDATVAGVMFTANPVTGTRHETVIDASPGLGEAVVSGAVNPDHFVVDSRTRTVVARRLGDKRIADPRPGPAAAPTASSGRTAVPSPAWTTPSCWSWPTWAATSRSTTEHRRTPNGRWTPTAGSG